MQFKYSLEASGKDRIPFIEIRIIKRDDETKATGYKAMLDSGAYINIFHSEIADVLGIDLSKIKAQEVFQGVEETGRKMQGKLYFVKLMIFQKGHNYTFEAPVVFSDQIARRGFALLGRQGFFDMFDEITFNYPENKFYLRKDKK